MSRPLSPSHLEPLTLSRTWRLVYMGVGGVCLGLGILGYILPLLPGTVFMIMAAFCFSKSCPWLQQRIYHNRIVGPAVRHWAENKTIPNRAYPYILASLLVTNIITVLVTDSVVTIGISLSAALVVAIWLGTLLDHPIIRKRD